jgi:hypothetical protein
MREVRTVSRTRIAGTNVLAAAAIAVVLTAACSVHTFRVTAVNGSAEEYFVRVRYDYGEVHVLRLPALTQTIPVFGQAGELNATIDLLRPDCAVVGSWRDASGGLITIGAHGSASFGANPDEEQAGGSYLPEVGASEVAACGNTQFLAPSPTSSPSPTGG